MLSASRSMPVLLLLWALGLCTAHSQQPDNPDDNLLIELNKRQQEMADPKTGNVPPPQTVKLCEICRQPLWKHALPDWKGCVPLNAKGDVMKVQEIVSRNALCPTCKATFSAAVPCNFNEDAGRDRDFCAHSTGKVTVHSDVWMCPNCGYAALIDSFNIGLDGKPISDETRRFVEEKIAPATRLRMIDIAGLNPRKDQPIPEKYLRFADYVEQPQIPDFLKYDHAIQIYEHFNPHHVVLAGLYLKAAHACRRQVCIEIAIPGLTSNWQEAIGKSIRRMQSFVLGECLSIHQRRGDALMDPLKPEIDMNVLNQGIAEVIRKGEEAGARAPTPGHAPEKDAFFTFADMFVLHLRQAGVLDRLGKPDEAAKALTKALSYIPENLQLEGANDSPQLKEFGAQQLKLVRGTVIDRQLCLKKEREYLFQAAKANMAAIKFNQLRIKEGEATPGQKYYEPGPTSYLLGEILRRAGDASAAAAWLDAAKTIAQRKLHDLESLPPPPPQPERVVRGGDPTPAQAQRDARASWQLLQQWADEQRALIAGAKEPDAYVREVIAQVLKAAGCPVPETPAAANPPAQPNQADVKIEIKSDLGGKQPEVAVKEPENAAPRKAVPVESGPIATREQLLKVYSTALTRYRADRNANPGTLSDLVVSGYITEEQAHINEQGRVICPETKDKLFYTANWTPEAKDTKVLAPITKSPKSALSLYADGSIR